jgi:predicted DNA binding CopG/RHH family protein
MIKERLTARLPVELIEKFRDRCKKRGLPMSTVIWELVNNYLEGVK